MTPKEVGSLQAVAKAHGGSLTINPHTGLAEAGFLKGLLPTLLGAGLAATGVGAPLAALMVGGGYTIANGGDLKKGLMAGLGAYGGAGLASSFGVAGAANPTTMGQSAVAADTDAMARMATQPTAIPPTPTVAPSAIPGGTTAENFQWDSATRANVPINTPPPAPPSPSYIEGQGVPYNPTATAPKSFDAMPTTDRVSAIGQGASVDNAGSFIKANPYTAAGTVASIYSGSKEDPKAPSPADPGMIRPYTFDRVRNEDAFLNTAGGKPLSSKEQRYFTDTYTAQTPYKAPGPEYMAAGGPVEQMSNNAAIGANTMYPMANMTTSAFATPYQDPRSTNMMASMAPSGGGSVDAMSGEPNMQGTRLATGGEIEFRGHFNANSSQGGGQGNGDNGYQSAGNGGDSSGILGKFQGQTGQPPAPYAPPNIAQETPLNYAGQAGNAVVDAWSQLHGGFASGGEVKRFGLGGLNVDSSFDPQNAPEGGIGSLIRTVMAGRQKQSSNPRQYTYDPQSQQYTEIQQGTPVPAYAIGGALGGYSDGGRMLKGPGDGMSDNIPATIGGKQPARLADGEFVVPADVVSHLGNGSTDAGAKQLYAMMDKIRAARTGTKKQGKQINPRKYMPA
jgi:hypothetical protein